MTMNEAKLTSIIRDATANEKKDKVTGKSYLHPYFRAKILKAEKIMARRSKAAQKSAQKHVNH
jgi:hypothetical protein